MGPRPVPPQGLSTELTPDPLGPSSPAGLCHRALGLGRSFLPNNSYWFPKNALALSPPVPQNSKTRLSPGSRRGGTHRQPGEEQPRERRGQLHRKLQDQQGR